jgi:hypothetical protein
MMSGLECKVIVVALLDEEHADGREGAAGVLPVQGEGGVAGHINLPHQAHFRLKIDFWCTKSIRINLCIVSFKIC